MSTAVRCPECDSEYKISDKFLGRRGKCKQCGASFVMSAEALEFEEDALSALSVGEAAEVERPEAPEVRFNEVGAGPSQFGTVESESRPETGGMGSYLGDILKSAIFFRSLGASVTFGIVALMLGAVPVLMFAGALGIVARFIIAGWYMAFLLNVVVDAASGEDDLPDLNVGAWVEGILYPLVKYLLTWLTALTPYVITLVYMVVFGQLTASEGADNLIAVATGDYAAAFDQTRGGGTLAGCMMLFSVVLWPIILLAAAVGGAAAVVRLDLMVVTILKSLHGYLVCVLLAYLGLIVPGLIHVFVEETAGINPTESFGLYQAFYLGMMVVTAYGGIIAMRSIGLYYHHFKHRFAWSWG